MPQRLQLSRRKGFRLPPDAINVARPTRYGNHHRVGYCPGCGETHDRATAVALFRRDLTAAIAAGAVSLYALRDHDLACWCRLSDICHADVLLELANAPLPARRRRPHNIRCQLNGGTFYLPVY